MKKIAIMLLILFVISTATDVFALGYKVRNIAGAATTVVRSGPGRLIAIHCNKAIALGVITIYDNTAASGTKIATITNPAALLAAQYSFLYNCEFRTGLTITTSLADDITVIYE